MELSGLASIVLIRSSSSCRVCGLPAKLALKSLGFDLIYLFILFTDNEIKVLMVLDSMCGESQRGKSQFRTKKCCCVMSRTWSLNKGRCVITGIRLSAGPRQRCVPVYVPGASGADKRRLKRPLALDGKRKSNAPLERFLTHIHLSAANRLSLKTLRRSLFNSM